MINCIKNYILTIFFILFLYPATAQVVFAYFAKIQRQNDNTFIICGSNNQPDPANGKGDLSKIDSLGNMSWERLYGNFLTDFNAVQVTSDSGFVAIGRTVNPDNQQYLYMVKTDRERLITELNTHDSNSVCLVYPTPVERLCTIVVPPGTSWLGIYISVGNIITVKT